MYVCTIRLKGFPFVERKNREGAIQGARRLIWLYERSRDCRLRRNNRLSTSSILWMCVCEFMYACLYIACVSGSWSDNIKDLEIGGDEETTGCRPLRFCDVRVYRYVCMYTYIHMPSRTVWAYMHTCIHAYMHTCIQYMHKRLFQARLNLKCGELPHTYTHTHTYSNTYTNTYIQSQIPIPSKAQRLKCCKLPHTHTRMHTHIHTHTYSHTCIHIYVQAYSEQGSMTEVSWTSTHIHT